jgi:putative phosphoesterase
MRIAVVSDVHGNRRALQAVLADMRQVAPDLVVHGGDLAYGGTRPAEVVDEIRSLGWLGVRGNTDEMLWSRKSLEDFAAKTPKLEPLLSRIRDLIPWTVAQLGDERLRWLESHPMQYAHEQFSLVHAAPGDVWRSPMANATDEELQNTYASLRAPIVVYGHIHTSFIRRLPGAAVRLPHAPGPGGMIVANSGSVSQSYDGDTRASYLVIDAGETTIRRVEYDVEAEANELRRSGMPNAGWLAKILLAGKYVTPE